nr:MAG TPA_asm: hypothetical protein [Caudoviricetes sp.]
MTLCRSFGKSELRFLRKRSAENPARCANTQSVHLTQAVKSFLFVKKSSKQLAATLPLGS